MSNKDISRYLTKENGSTFSNDTELLSLATNSKVKNVNTGLTFKKVDGNVFDKTPIEATNANAVLYVQQSLTNAQKTQARENILAGRADSVTLSGTDLKLLNIAGTAISSVSLSSLVQGDSFYGDTQPDWNTLFTSSTGLDEGDIILSKAFTNYQYLIFVFGTDDNSPSDLSGPWGYAIHPVWLLKQLIVDKYCFGRSNVAKFNLTWEFERRWEIDPSQSTTTRLKHIYNNKVCIWRVYGVGAGSSSSTETTVAGTWYYVSTSSTAPSSTTLIPSSSIWARYTEGSGSDGYTYYSSTTTYAGSGSHPSNGSYKATWSRVGGSGSNYLYKATGIIKVA